MIDIKQLSADQILDFKTPEQLFSKENIEHEWKILRSLWHPDKNKQLDAEQVFKYLQELYNDANKLISNNIWKGAADIEIISSDGTKFIIRYKKMHIFELGMMCISSTKICFIIKPEYEKLFDNGIRTIQNQIKYPAQKFKDEFERYMPKIVKVLKNTNVGHVLVLEKTPDLILLHDLLDYTGRQLPSRHTAWIISSLCNLLCFFELIKIVHLGLSEYTLFISPKHHSICIYGGWWYAKENESKMLAIPSTLATILPSNIFVDKLAKFKYDRQLVKAIGLLSLGDKMMTGSSLLKNPDIPKPMLDFFRSQSNITSFEMYEQWSKVLDASFGKRTFVNLDVDITEIYR